MRARQTRGNALLAAELERAWERGLHERLLALADAAGAVEPDAESAAIEPAASIDEPA